MEDGFGLAEGETRDRYGLSVLEGSFTVDVNREVKALFVSIGVLRCYI